MKARSTTHDTRIPVSPPHARLAPLLIGLVLLAGCQARQASEDRSRSLDPASPPADARPPSTIAAPEDDDSPAAAPEAADSPTALPDRAPGVSTFIVCDDIFPGLPDCLGQAPLGSGRIAFTHATDRLQTPEEGALRVVDLASGSLWYRREPAARLDWSPDGRYLLARTGDDLAILDLATEPPATLPLTRTLGTDLKRFSVTWAAPGLPFEPDPEGGATLLIQTEAGALVGLDLPGGERRVLIPAGAGAQTWPAAVAIAEDGWLAWTRLVDEARIPEAGSSQDLELRGPGEDGPDEDGPDGAGPAVSWPISEDLRSEQHELRGWVPGTRLLWTRQGLYGSSVWGWGLPLATIDADTGLVRRFDEAGLPSWAEPDFHPRDPGRLVMPEGGARETFDGYGLTLLDLLGGETRTLIAESERLSIHDPRWSPSGDQIAFSAAEGLQEHATWDAESLAELERGRAIFTIDPATGQRRQLTEPAPAGEPWASDRSPLWLPEGDRLLYERLLEAGSECPACPERRQLRVVWADGSRDELLLDHVGVWAYHPGTSHDIPPASGDPRPSAQP